MEIMRISSRDEDIRKNEETIKKFEKENDNGKLKLLFSVNMLNEGYHLENLDGVIMMRPTHSPTLYYQQLGRALSVGNDKQPIVIDLVNNIDTIEIIEGFCKRLGEAKERNNVESSTKFSISEETRKIRDIVNKIDSLVSRTKPLTNEEKLALMTEYINEIGEKIVAGTVYKGHNIGAMKNNLRQAYYNGNLNIDENLLQSFIDAGILVEEKERIRTSEQEKYEFLISALEKSPEERKKLTMESGLSYAAARAELQVRYNRGTIKLTQEQIETLKANGILNLSSKEKEELKVKHEKLLEYGIKIDEIIDIEKQYGSFESFMDKFKRGECEYPFSKSVFIGAKYIAVSSREITEEQKLHYVELVKDVLDEDIIYKDGCYLNIDKIDYALKKLPPREEKVIRMSFGLDGEKFSNKEIGEEIGRKSNIYEVVNKGLRRLRHVSRKKYLCFRDINEELKQIEEKINGVRNALDNANKMKNFVMQEKTNVNIRIDEKRLEENGISKEEFEDFFYVSLSDDKIIASDENKDKLDLDMLIEELDFSVRTYNCIKRAGIDCVSDILDRDVDDIKKLRNLGSRSFDEVITKLGTFGIEIVEDKDGTRKFKSIKDISENSNNNLDLVEKCDKEINILNEMLSSFEEERAKLDQKAEIYDSICKYYLENENILDPNAIIPAITDVEQIRLFDLNDKDSTKSNETEIGEESEEQKRKRELIESIRESQEELEYLEDELDWLDDDFDIGSDEIFD